MMIDSRKKWLILAHCFNMDGRAASQTITDKIPFLMKNGIDPIVISAPTGTKDKEFIHCQVLSPAPSGILFEMRKIIDKNVKNQRNSLLLKAVLTVLCGPFYGIEKLFINLDSHWSWFITAGMKGVFLIKKYRPQLIYSTAGPSSTHLTGYILNKLFKIPWIAEIHDPLISESETVKKVYQRYEFQKWLEKKIFENADVIIYFTEKACENAKQRTKVTHNAHVLRPGANPPGVVDVQYIKGGKIHFGHFGSLASDRNLFCLMEALANIFKKHPHLKSKVVFDVYGTKLDSASKRAVETFSLETVVCEHGRLEYDSLTRKSGRQKVFEKMHLCDVLVLIHGHSDVGDEYIPSKLYEYLLTQRPIMGIATNKTELASILTLGHKVLDPTNLMKLESALEGYMNQWEKNQLEPIGQKSVFTVENTVEKLMGMAESCCSK